MTMPQSVSNPFALMMDSESLQAAVAASERLTRLRRRIFRPLDRLQFASPSCSEEHTAVGGLDELNEPNASRF